MKTLDEVIKAYEICHASVLSCEGCPYDNGERWRDSDCYLTDALHYLRVLKDILDPLNVKKISHEITCPQCNSVIAILLPESNDPLTWDELKQMEGKPVWVEIDGYKGYWTIVHWNSNIVFEEYYDWNASPEDPMKAPLVSLDDTNFGKTWRAYRKERG